MATLIELADFIGTANYGTLLKKVEEAVKIKAFNITEEASPTAAELAWAESTYENSRVQAEKTLPYMIAANNTSAISVIETAADGTIQTNVNDAVDNLFGL